MGIGHLLKDVGNVLFGGLVQLLRTVLQRALTEQVDDPPATGTYPVDGLSAIHESEHLDTVETAQSVGIVADFSHRLLVAVADTCRGHLDAVDIDSPQQFARHHHLLVWQEADTAGLFAVAQRTIQDFYI